MTFQNKIEIKCAVCEDTLYVENSTDYRFRSDGYFCYKCNSNMLNTKAPHNHWKNNNENGDYTEPQE